VVYRHCLLDETCGQKSVFPSSHDLKDISELTVDQVGGEGVTDTQPPKVGELIGQ
jgi:hypothetical protein